MATLTIDDALRAVQRDPVAGFVGLAVAAAQPPSPGVVVETKGQRLLLPDWTGDEWRWYAALALRIAATKETVGDTAVVASKARAVAKLQADVAALPSGPVQVGATQTLSVYRDSVQVVLASSAAAENGPGFASAAVAAFGESLREAPATLRAAFSRGLDNMTSVQREAARILGELFARPLAAVTGGLLAGLGPFGVAVLAVGAYYLFGKRR